MPEKVYDGGLRLFGLCLLTLALLFLIRAAVSFFLGN